MSNHLKFLSSFTMYVFNANLTQKYEIFFELFLYDSKLMHYIIVNLFSNLLRTVLPGFKHEGPEQERSSLF